MQEDREAINERLKAIILEYAAKFGKDTTAIPELSLAKRTQTDMFCRVYTPFVGLTVQGQKYSIVGKTKYCYEKYHCFIIGIDAPSEGCVALATPEEPFLAISLELDRKLIAELALEMPYTGTRHTDTNRSAAILEADSRIMTAFLRLAELVNDPDDIPILAPMLKREIHLRLLLGPQGYWLRSFCCYGTPGNQVAQAVSWLRDHYREGLQVEELAHRVGLSVSSFFRKFKQMTSLSPLQFQKNLRLYEAQRLMLSEGQNVANAAYDVGYESSTQFIREYKRLFGAPPHQDISQKLRQFV